MSLEGIKKVAEVFGVMQQTREELMREATAKKPIDRQDLMLAQLLETGKDSMKWRFCELTVMKKRDL